MNKNNLYSLYGFLLLVGFLSVVGTVRAQSAQSLPSEVIAYADLVLHNGKILTVDEKFTIVQAVAIRDGKFLAVGESDRILAMAGPQTRRIDLQGRSVVPGFIDTHLHSAFTGNIAKAGLVGRLEFKSVASGLEEIKGLVAKAEPGETIFLSGPSNKFLIREVTLAQLDAVAPRNPLAISCSNNQVVVNSLVLERVPANTPGILKDEAGSPTGQLRGGASGVVIYELTPWPDVEKVATQQKQEFRRYLAQGLTTIMGRAQGLSMTVFRELWKRGELEPRVRVLHEFLRQNANPESYLKRIGNLTDFGDDKLKITGATVQVVDGSTGPGAGRTSKPKLNLAPGDPYGPYGQNKWEETGDVSTSDRRNIILGNRYGWSIGSLHSSGDVSNTILLEAFEEAHREKSLVGRHFGIDHGMMWKPEHYEKIKEMDVVPSIYAKALYNNDNLVHMYGMDAVYGMQPVKSLIEAGIKPAAEADTRPPYSAPLFNIQRWVTRLDDKGRQLDPDEKISREEALYMYTVWAARYSGEENILGSIEPGKLADLAVLAGDYLTFPEEDLDKLRVLMTVVGGQVVHEVARAF
ncbi:amidohydrolase family protein [Acidobacteria bacterium AH-259-D05]|nr:amidohydrolase family protein [Acidobacteria bacterium AH-259-D05]